MMKYFSGRIARCNAVCALLILVLILLQFVPFWHYGEAEEDSISIAKYIWSPGKYIAVDEHIQAQTSPDYHIDDIFWTPFLIEIIGVLAILLCLALANVPWVSLASGVVGIIAAYGYIFKPAMHLGAGWQLHLLIGIAILAISAVSVCLGIKDRKAHV